MSRSKEVFLFNKALNILVFTVILQTYSQALLKYRERTCYCHLSYMLVSLLLTFCTDTIRMCQRYLCSTPCEENSAVTYLMAWTTTILNSSEISDMKEEICFMRRSTLLSFPVLSSVVIASVAILRFTSVIRFSRSRLQAVTAAGCFMAT